MPSIKTSSGDGPRRHIQGIASKPEDVKLRGESFIATVTDQIVGDGIQINRTIEGASTLTIPLLDDSGDLRTHPLFQSRFEVEVDGLKFVFVAKSKDDANALTLTLEAKNVWRLRQHSGPEKAYREKVTRAEFWVNLVKTLRPKIDVFCPQLHKVQPIKSAAQSRTASADADVHRQRGLSEAADLTAKGQQLTPAQVDAADRALRAAESNGATVEVMIGLVMSLINESLISDQAGGLADSAGWLQLQASDHPGVDPHNLELVVNLFVTEGFTGAGSALELSKRYPTAEWVGKVMWMNSATTYPGAQYEGEARAIVSAFNGGDLSTDAQTIEETKRYPFTIAANETWWAGGQRLFSEVNWRLFEAADLIYVIAETALMRSRVRMIVREGAPGIDSITWNQDSGQKVHEVSITGRAKDWAAPPGTVCEVKGQGESVDGNYIVASIPSFLANEDITATLKRPSKPLPEPAAETTTKTIGGFGESASSGNAPEAVQRVIDDIERLSKLGLSYVFGGGHQTPAPANGPYDCSSFASREVQLVDPSAPTMATGSLASYGAEGKGKWFTIYVHNGGAGGGHTLIEVDGRFAECGGSDNPDPNGGPSWIEPSSERLAGFESIRHPEGF